MKGKTWTLSLIVFLSKRELRFQKPLPENVPAAVCVWLATLLAMENPLVLIDKIEQLVEKGGGWMGKRLINEEEFLTLILQLRSALPQAIKNLETMRGSSKAARDLIEETRFLTDKEQLEIVAILSRRLLEKQL